MVYKSILRYTDQVKKVQMENGFVSSITALTGNLFSELQTSIRDQDTEVVRLSGFAADLGLARLGENLLTQLQESHKTIVNINRRALDEHKIVILDWLSAMPYSMAQDTKKLCREPGSGNWFLNSAKYIN